MDRGDFPISIGAKIKSIASVVAEKNASEIQDYERILVVFDEQRSSGCTLSLSHLW